MKNKYEFLEKMQTERMYAEAATKANYKEIFGSDYYNDVAKELFEFPLVLKPIMKKDGILLSVQASRATYCHPRENLELSKYTHMEVAFLYEEGGFCKFSDINYELDKKLGLDIFLDEVVYRYVPVEIIDLIYESFK